MVIKYQPSTTRGVFAVLLAGFFITCLVRFLPDSAGTLGRVEFRQFLQLLFEIGVYIALAGYIAGRVNFWVGSLLALATFSTFYPQFNGYGPLHTLMMGCIAYLLLVKVGHAKHLIYAICIVGVANAVLLTSQYFGYDPLTGGVYVAKKGFGLETRPIGFCTNRNEVSALLAICIPAYFRLPNQWPCFVIFPIVGMYFAQSLGGPVSIIAALVIVCLLYDRLKPGVNYKLSILIIAFGIIAMVATAAVDPKSITDSVLQRYSENWLPSFLIFKNNWIFGVGYGSFKDAWQTHNEYLHLSAQIGCAGFLLAIGFILQQFIRWTKNLNTLFIPFLAITTIAINATVNFPLHIAPTAFVCLFWFAVMEIEAKHEPGRV